MIWKFINTGACGGAFNIDVDERLVSQRLNNAFPTVLRIYAWSPPAVSVGYHQSFDQFNHDKLRAEGVDLVRRPTGGRAIFHSQELTYSVVTQLTTSTLTEIYRLMNTALLAGVRTLGIPAELASESSHFRDLYRTKLSASCFSSCAKNEIRVEGKKIVGSAQRRY